MKLAQGHLGMVVCLDRRRPQRGRAQRNRGHKQIFLRPNRVKNAMDGPWPTKSAST